MTPTHHTGGPDPRGTVETACALRLLSVCCIFDFVALNRISGKGRVKYKHPLSLNRSSLNKETKTDGKLTGIAALCTFRCFIFCRSDDDIAVSAAAAAVTHINILNCHSCLV